MLGIWQAWKHYWKGEHQQCKKHLEQVQSQKTGASDVRVAHNVAVNAYFASGCADPQDLLSKLTTHYDRALAALPTATAPKNKGNQPTKHLNQRQRKKAKAREFFFFFFFYLSWFRPLAFGLWLLAFRRVGFRLPRILALGFQLLGFAFIPAYYEMQLL